MVSESERLWSILPVLPTDYTDYGGMVERWKEPDRLYNDCSQSCKWARFIEEGEGGDPSLDWLVCTSPTGPRRGLLTWEHQAGEGCWEIDPDLEAEEEGVE